MLNEAMIDLFDRTPAEGERHTLFFAQMPDTPHEIAYVLIAPLGLTEAEWIQLAEDADSLWCDMDQAREAGTLEEDYDLEQREAFEQNVEGIACFLAAWKGWYVRPVSRFAWLRKVVPA